MSSKSQEHSSTSQPESRQARPSGKTIITILLILIGILALDQISKSIVVAQLPLFPEEGSSIAVIGDFLRITHLTNDAMLFSIGRGLGNLVKRILFTGLPLLILLWLLYMLFFDKSLHTLMRYQFALIAGGGLGNLSDRLFRGGVVVDFIDVKFYGIFGLERWPTFNIADSAVVVGVILFFVFSFAKRET